MTKQEKVEKQVFSIWWQKMLQHRENRLAERMCLALRGVEQRKLMRAELHHQHTVLLRALQAWVTYQGRVQSILQEVAAKESQHNRQLLR
ncbi:hypothetical protein P7K49_002801 [Saguinus oedipus]|uniref:Uncharacterized protein n=1 Tax=Saguinus oedipus TaxID=9490 RepID=A0ABQ9WIC9_SAGOE|nr:hypothetical protein P7K49_002801 [Saguinus oedipus]